MKFPQTRHWLINPINDEVKSKVLPAHAIKMLRKQPRYPLAKGLIPC